jgi:hypothetical protein
MRTPIERYEEHSSWDNPSYLKLGVKHPMTANIGSISVTYADYSQPFVAIADSKN